ncbi:MAG: hydroxyacylglutathione hydrolase [Simkaniaceae bacterium]|nr:hydroxyacylglutathione hydrolase [Simkaniaceae bacterium]
MENVEEIRVGDGESYLHIIPALQDNYIYLLSRERNAVIVDPGDPDPVLSLVEAKQYRLMSALITHHHGDHTGGNEQIHKKTGCRIIGPEDERIPCLQQSVADGEELVFDPFKIEVISTQGHTRPHVAYFFRDLNFLFSGDLLFGAGCGRLTEGTAEEMFASLQKIKKLPETTRIFFGHEYTEKNLEFALLVEPEAPAAVRDRLEKVRKIREEKRPTAPSDLATEKATNPFLRTDDEHLQKVLGMEDASPLEVFVRLRSMRDEHR